MLIRRVLTLFCFSLFFFGVGNTATELKCDPQKLTSANLDNLISRLQQPPPTENAPLVKASQVSSFTFFEALPRTDIDTVYKTIQDFLAAESHYNLVLFKEENVFVMIDKFGGQHEEMERVLFQFAFGNEPVIKILGGTRLINYRLSPKIVESHYLREYGSGIAVHQRVLKNLVIEEVRSHDRSMRSNSIYQGALATVIGYRTFQWELKKKGNEIIIVGKPGDLL